MTGDMPDGEINDMKSFAEAYLYYRKLYKRIEQKDIEDFSKKYKNSADEEADLLSYFRE